MFGSLGVKLLKNIPAICAKGVALGSSTCLLLSIGRILVFYSHFYCVKIICEMLCVLGYRKLN